MPKYYINNIKEFADFTHVGLSLVDSEMMAMGVHLDHSLPDAKTYEARMYMRPAKINNTPTSFNTRSEPMLSPTFKEQTFVRKRLMNIWNETFYVWEEI